MAAAVADFRPKAAAGHKLKKADGAPDVVLEPTPDILASLGASRRAEQILVGFAAETASFSPGDAHDRLVGYARGKLTAKAADLIVANDVAAPGVGFAHDTNSVVIVGAGGAVIDVALQTKQQVAVAVVDAIEAVRATRLSGHPSRRNGADGAGSAPPPKERS
jgi:phosphopantothenoylcysteine decarboxylase/phosphopantothenate--cysteine ligase